MNTDTRRFKFRQATWDPPWQGLTRGLFLESPDNKWARKAFLTFAVCTFDINDFSSFADNRIELSLNKQNKMDWLVSRNCSFNLQLLILLALAIKVTRTLEKQAPFDLVLLFKCTLQNTEKIFNGCVEVYIYLSTKFSV